ncbi:hypothetical protein TRFO_08370 [Tritrichomonas foetus]|uniref:Tubby C-terminal domain-containing protein n=1 Tax=Tritrichomonas foetus TaxID=1144522 RepID=A0A1J4JPK0_9EUKA|nr:hypothetical protein TRFO_08370 [Tritrichomonas foetus]|eukprot:OHS99443.1 hypothetical protein TRFO_08370 [Tritrichomonas foetus]
MRKRNAPHRPGQINRINPRCGHNRLSNAPRPKILLNFSDSTSDSDSSGNIVVVDVKKLKTPLLISESSETSNDVDGEFIDQKMNQSNIHSNNFSQNQNLSNKPENLRNRNADWQPKPPSNIRPSPPRQRNMNRFMRNRSPQPTSIHRKVQISNNDDKNQSKSDENDHQIHTNETLQQPPKKLISPETIPIKTENHNSIENDQQLNIDDQSLNTPVEKNQTTDEEIEIGSDELQEFQVVRSGKSFGKLKLKMVNPHTNEVIFTSKDKKSNRKNYHLITIATNDPLSIPAFVGPIRSHKKESRFTFYSMQKKNECDDREGEIVGIAFSKPGSSSDDPIQSPNLKTGTNNGMALNEKMGVRMNVEMTVLITKMDVPHYPITQRLTLEQMAVSNCIPLNFRDKFIKLKPIRIEDDVKSELGSTFFMHSVKNMVLVEEESKVVVFAFLKSTDNVFHLKIRKPLSLSQAFSIAISLFKYRVK